MSRTARKVYDWTRGRHSVRPVQDLLLHHRRLHRSNIVVVISPGLMPLTIDRGQPPPRRVLPPHLLINIHRPFSVVPKHYNRHQGEGAGEE